MAIPYPGYRLATSAREYSNSPFESAEAKGLGTEQNVEYALFQTGTFRLHSGEESSFKIECDNLTDQDWAALAQIIVTRIPAFGEVEGVPSGGLQLAAELEPYATEGSVLIVDDVLTTGASMEKHRAGREAIGAVVFARNGCPDWVTPLFTMATRIDGDEARRRASNGPLVMPLVQVRFKDDGYSKPTLNEALEPCDPPEHSDDGESGEYSSEPRHGKGRDCARTEEVLESYRRRAIRAELEVARLTAHDRRR